MNEKIRPCPFCGGQAILIGRELYFSQTNEKSYHIECSKCMVRTVEVMDKESVVKHWNRRAENE